MSWRLVVAGCALPLVLSGCVVTRAGTPTKIPDGPAVPVTVAVREESATVRGLNPLTGEALTGVLQIEHAERPSGGLAPAPGIGPHIGLAPAAGASPMCGPMPGAGASPPEGRSACSI